MQEKSTLLPVVAVALIDSGGRVLMQRRPRGKQHGGLWEFPGGKVEAGETPEISAIREIEEELGITISSEALVPLTFAANSMGDRSAGDRPIVILLYICRVWIGQPQCLDGAELCWIAPAGILELDMPPLDRPLARTLISSI